MFRIRGCASSPTTGPRGCWAGTSRSGGADDEESVSAVGFCPAEARGAARDDGARIIRGEAAEEQNEEGGVTCAARNEDPDALVWLVRTIVRDARGRGLRGSALLRRGVCRNIVDGRVLDCGDPPAVAPRLDALDLELADGKDATYPAEGAQLVCRLIAVRRLARSVG